MYRPSDVEINAAAKVIKAWGMENGYHTAAVLALVAAEKVRRPRKVRKNMDSEFIRFMDGVTGVIECTREEQMYMWEKAKEYGYNWKENSSGLLETVGYLDGRPICISLFTAEINGTKILLWHATSQLVDYKKINKWLELNTPNNRTDATNWTNVIPRLEKETK